MNPERTDCRDVRFIAACDPRVVPKQTVQG